MKRPKVAPLRPKLVVKASGSPKPSPEPEPEPKQEGLEHLESLIETTNDPEVLAEASFKVGLYRLATDRDVEKAQDALRRAVRTGKEPWSQQARISLAQVLFRTGRPQQAAFELRKASDTDDLVAAQARALLIEVLRSMDRSAESEKLREVHKSALARLCEQPDSEVAATASVWLGMEYKHDGERKLAKAALERSLTMKALPDAPRRLAEATLAEL